MTKTMTKEEILKGIKDGSITFLKVTVRFKHEEQLSKFRRYLNEVKVVPELDLSNSLETVIVIPVEFYGQLLMVLGFGIDAKDCSIEATADDSLETVYEIQCTEDRYFPSTNLPVFKQGISYSAKGRCGILYAEIKGERYIIGIDKDSNWMNDQVFSDHFILS